MNKLIVVPIMALVLLAIDYYVFQGVKTAFSGLSPASRKGLQAAYWLFTALLIAGIFAYNFVAPDRLGHTLRTMMMAGIFIAYFSKIIMLPFVLVDDLVRLGKWLYAAIFPQPAPDAFAGEGISRSEFLGRVGLAVASVPAAGMVYGIVAGAHDYRVRRETVFLPHLPEAFDGLRIAQISDIHSGSFFNRSAVRRGVRMLLGERPDVVFFTGDLVNNTADELDRYEEVFREVKAPMGVFSVLGNHDYGDYVRWESAEAKAANLERLKQVQARMGWRLLLNEHVMLERGGERIAVIGIENWGMGGFSQYGDLAKAYRGSEEAPVKLLLSHDPSHWRGQVLPQYPGIDMAFAGHTHGMQFGVEVAGIKWSPVKHRYPEWGGLYREGRQYLYVNRGFGYIGYPGRIGMPPEITLVELRRGNPLA